MAKLVERTYKIDIPLSYSPSVLNTRTFHTMDAAVPEIVRGAHFLVGIFDARD